MDYTQEQQQRALLRELDHWLDEQLLAHSITFRTASHIDWPGEFNVPAALRAIRVHQTEVVREYLAGKRKHLIRKLIGKTLRASYRRWKRP